MNNNRLIPELQSNSVISQCFIEGLVETPDGGKHRLHSNTAIPNANALYRFIRNRRPTKIVEIGMAFGASTLAILKALSDNENGHLVSMDPYIGWPKAEEIAKHQVARSGWTHLHTHLKAPSFQGLTEMFVAGDKVDLVYVDGFHRYDYVFADAFLADKVLIEGGVLVFNDCGWRSVHRAIRHFLADNPYREIDAGLRRSFSARNPLFSVIKRFEGRSNFDRYFEKIDSTKD
jgi:predicted O-methyltransferase YrrM